ncbi:MAG: MFS transporter [Alphaproteobacteria bacterium]|nr:MFS transporter [Alphaproteobacteria bacterium]MCY4496996.1 MFS transporter [Rhodospirillaceae bacterium]
MIRFSGLTRIVQALGQPNYGVYMAGMSVSMIGLWMQRLGVGWLTWELTESAAWLGAVAFADLFPAVLVAPIGGSAADRWDRLRLTKISQVLSLLQAVALFGLTVSGLITIEILFALTLFLGIVTAFHQPVRMALVPSLVRREYLPTAVALSSISFNLARFIGPAFAGVVILAFGTGATFGLNALSFAVFLWALGRVRIENTVTPRQQDRPGLVREFGDGVRYVASHAGVAPILMILIVVCLGIRPFQELLPGFADHVFGGGADILAVLTCATGVGAVVGGLWLAQRGGPSGLTKLILIATVIQALSMFVFVATDSLWVAVPAVTVAGLGMTMTGIGVQTLMQLTVDASVRGRVLSIFGLTFRGMPALGALIMGAASESVGLRWPLATGAFLVLLSLIWAWRQLSGISSSLEAQAAQG